MQVSPHKRYVALDSLRGLGALTVVIYHSVLFLPDNWRASIHSVDMALFMASRFAVMLFFALSGFVLALPYQTGPGPAYKSYLVRRFCRLYPPFACAVLLAVILRLWLGGMPLPLDAHWLNVFWISPVTPSMVAAHFLMAGVNGDLSTSLDGSIWSLVIEMRVSILFGLLAMYARWTGYAGLVLAFVVAFACGHAREAMGDTSPHVAESVWGTILLTGHYLPIFLMGIIAALRLDQLKIFFVHVPRWGHAAVCGGFIVLWGASAVLGLENRGFQDMFYGALGTYIIILCIVFPQVGEKLSGRLCRWLGDASYSLYLTHMPILLALYHGLFGIAPIGLIFVSAFPIVMLAAHVMQIYVERPSIKLGRILARRLDEPPVSSVTTI